MKLSITVRRMRSEDIARIHEGLAPHDVSKPLSYIEQCWRENEQEEQRLTLIAWQGSEFAGWGHVVYASSYPYFAEKRIPEIQNLDVVPLCANAALAVC